MTVSAVNTYLNSLSSQELENLFMEFVEYRTNYELENQVCLLEAKIEELEEEIDCFRNGENYYE